MVANCAGIPEPPDGWKIVGWGNVQQHQLMLDFTGNWVSPGCRGGQYLVAEKL